MKMTVKVEGLREVEKAFAEIGKAASKRVAQNALKQGGEILAKRMRQLAPRDEGNLIESIDVSTRLTRAQRQKHEKRAPVEMFVGPNNPAAVPQEFGTFKEPPQPFARPAWDETQGEVLKRISDELMVGVDKAVQRARRKVK